MFIDFIELGLIALIAGDNKFFMIFLSDFRVFINHFGIKVELDMGVYICLVFG